MWPSEKNTPPLHYLVMTHEATLVFPKLTSGHVTISMISGGGGAITERPHWQAVKRPHRWAIQARNLNQTDADALLDLFLACKGRFQPFEFMYQGRSFTCYFESDTLPKTRTSTGCQYDFTFESRQ
jgi:hypothetical protein